MQTQTQTQMQTQTQTPYLILPHDLCILTSLIEEHQLREYNTSLFRCPTCNSEAVIFATVECQECGHIADFPASILAATSASTLEVTAASMLASLPCARCNGDRRIHYYLRCPQNSYHYIRSNLRQVRRGCDDSRCYELQDAGSRNEDVIVAPSLTETYVIQYKDLKQSQLQYIVSAGIPINLDQHRCRTCRSEVELWVSGFCRRCGRGCYYKYQNEMQEWFCRCGTSFIVNRVDVCCKRGILHVTGIDYTCKHYTTLGQCSVCKADTYIQCEVCGACEDCGCSCQRVACGHTVCEFGICIRCGLCKDCCHCTSNQQQDRCETRNAALTKNVVFMRNDILNNATFTVPDSFCVGVELEVDKLDYTKTEEVRHLVYYIIEHGIAAVRDGSVPFGIEFVTPPIEIEKFPQFITAFTQVLNKCDPQISKQAGLHVHLDARGMTFEDLFKLVLVYEVFEPVLFAMQPDSRLESYYCTSVRSHYVANFKKSTDLAGVFARLLDCEAGFARLLAWEANKLEFFKAVARNDKYRWDQRRFSMNLVAFLRYETIEFRMHSGTTDPFKIINWVRILCAIFNCAQNLKKEPLKIRRRRRRKSLWRKFIGIFSKQNCEQEYDLLPLIQSIVPGDLYTYIEERIYKAKQNGVHGRSLTSRVPDPTLTFNTFYAQK